MVREHTEAISPPRALWVGFPLGRPFGLPGDAPFQRRVLRAALDLFDRADGPLLEDYDRDLPDQADADATGWACPVSLAPPPASEDDLAAALARELRSLLPWYELSRERRGRTTVGAGALDPEAAAAFVGSFLDGCPDNPAPELSIEEVFRQCVEDLKALYCEAATARPGAAARDVGRWLWNETALGRVLLVLRRRLLEGAHAGLKSVAEHSLVPRAVLEARGLPRPSRPDWHMPQ